MKYTIISIISLAIGYWWGYNAHSHYTNLSEIKTKESIQNQVYKKVKSSDGTDLGVYTAIYEVCISNGVEDTTLINELLSQYYL